MMPPHAVYVEPFVGSGSVLFAKEKADVEVVNDTDPDVADAWRVLAKLSEDQTKQLAGMNWTGDRSTYEKMLKGSASGDLAKLHRFLYMSRFSYGKMRTRGFDPSAQDKPSTIPKKLETMAPRVHGVKVSCEDYEKVCRKYDGSDTLHFLDPPYVGTNTHVAEPDFDEKRFFKMLTELKGKWIVTYGTKGELPKMLRNSKYTVKTVETNRSIRAMRGTADEAKLHQIIAYNFDLPKKVEKAEDDLANIWGQDSRVSKEAGESGHPVADQYASIAKMEVSAVTAESLRGVDDQELLFIHSWMHRFYNAVFRGNDNESAGGTTRAHLVAAERLMQAEMARRGIKTRPPHAQHGLTREAAVRKSQGKPGAKVLCFYHRDLDGVASAAVVAQAHSDAELMSINYGEGFPWSAIKNRELVYMVDFGLQPFRDMVKLKAALEKQDTRFIWIDHHVTALEDAKKAGFDADGLRKNGDAGCELTWKFLHPDEPVPEVVRLAGRFDVWDHTDPNVLPVHYAMEATEAANDPSNSWWGQWLKKDKADFGELVAQGKAIEGWLEQFSASRMGHSSFDVTLDELKCVAACTSIPGSMQFESVRSGYDAAIAFGFSPSNQWDVSMYALKDGVDVGKVCAAHGGGGHKGAGGFQCERLPFDLPASVQKAYDLREPLAAYAHDVWSRWMKHLFSRTDDGAITPEDAERWKRQMATPYADLTEEKKESDRKEADRMLAVMSGRTKVEKADKSHLHPPRVFAPMAPSEKNSFDDVNDLLKEFATDEALQGGLGVEPNGGGRVVVVQSDGAGKEVVYLGDDRTDQSKAYPSLVEGAAKVSESFIFVGELHGKADDPGAKILVRDVLYWRGTNHASDPWEERKKILSQALPKTVGPFVPLPARVVHSKDKLKAAIKWSTQVPGSTGVLITVAGSTYSTEGSSTAVAALKVARIVNGIVIGKDSKGSGSWVYRCAIGPLSDADSKRMREVVEIDGRNYTPVGSTSPSSVEAQEGETLRVEVGEILVVDSSESATVTWLTGTALERVHVKPATIADVRALARRHEIQKLCKIIKRDAERHYVLSVVLEPNDGEGEAPLDPDAHNEIYSDDEIWDACVYWYEQGSTLGVDHVREVSTAEMLPIHNWIAPVDMVIDDEKVRAGTWLVGSLVLSAGLWHRVDTGELNAWSVDGEALRRPEAKAA
jgi:site-specific DNA-adenine methylase